MSINLTSTFDASFYRSNNFDLTNFNDAEAFSHFQNFGLKEGRMFSPWGNLNFYRSSNSDLAQLNYQQLFEHLQNYGVNEGRIFSPFINLNFYRANNSDLQVLNNEQLFEHLRNYGIDEERSFSPWFNLDDYRQINRSYAVEGTRFYNYSPESTLRGQQLFQYLQTDGINQGRRFSLLFDLNSYRLSNPDLKKLTNEQLFEHWQNYGLNEGRRFSPFIDLNVYLNQNPDVAQACKGNRLQALQHLDMYGLNEERVFSRFVDLNYYKTSNPNSSASGLSGKDLFKNFQTEGIMNGRIFSVGFNSNFYRFANPDLTARNSLNNQQLFDQFQLFGLDEGRASAPEFFVNYYLEHNPDLSAAGFSYQQAYEHFVRYGFSENRLAYDKNSSMFKIDLSGMSLYVYGARYKASTSPSPTNKVSLLYTYQNTKGWANEFQVGFYLSKDNTIDANDYFLGNSTFKWSDGYIKHQDWIDLSLPDSTNPFLSGDGTYYIGMIVDSTNTVPEVDETNNANVKAKILLDSSGYRLMF